MAITQAVPVVTGVFGAVVATGRFLTSVRASVAAVLGALVLFVIACGGDAGPGATQLPTSSPVPTTVSPAFAACDLARPHEPGTSYETIASGGQEWEYRIDVPSSYTGEEAVPLALNFHGLNGSPGEQAAISDLPAKGEEAGFVVVTPQGSLVPAVPGFINVAYPGWDQYVSGHEELNALVREGRLVDLYGPDHEDASVAFVDDLLDGLEVSLCIDSDRIYSTGASNGAALSIILACVRSNRIAAIAPVAETFFCRSDRPVPVISFHGSNDPVAPYQGRPVGGGLEAVLPNLVFPPVEEAVAAWADRNGCASPPLRESVNEDVARVRYEGCAQGATVELYHVLGVGHEWPPAESAGIVATDLIWDFFLEHPMP